MKGKLVAANVKAVQVGDIDILLQELVNATVEVASDANKGAELALQREYDKQSALLTLETLKHRKIDEKKLVEMDKSGRMKTIVAEVLVLRKFEESGKTLGGIFIPALGPNHPAMLKRAEIEKIIADGLKQANKAVDEAIAQQTAYCTQMGYIGKPPVAVRTTSKK